MDSLSTASRALAILREVYSQRSLRDVTLQILRTACEISGSIHGSFIRVCHDSRLLSIESTIGPDWTDALRSSHIPLGTGITGLTALSGEPYVCHDTRLDPHYIELFPFIRSELAVPVKVNGRVWGIINLDGTQPHEYQPQLVLDVCLFAELIAAAIEYRLKNDRERELQKRLAQAEKLSASGQLLAGIAHEINNPLAAILGISSLLAAELTTPAHLEAARLIEKQAQRAGDLIRHLLSFSRQSEEHVHRDEDLIAVVRESIDFVRPQLRLSRAALKVHIAGESSLRARLDRVQIQQVVINLITNAQHAIASKGEHGRITVSIDTDGTHAYLAVEDNGTGFNRETRERVFQPFFTTKRSGSGTGLGLSICREIASRHNGSLSCSSVEDRGSRFQFQLPLSPRSDSAAPALLLPRPHHASPTTLASDHRILVVDDEQPIRWMLERLFQSVTPHVSVVASAEDALELCRTTAFDVLVSDVHLTGMDGVELVSQIQALPGVALPRFILITGDVTTARLRTIPPECRVHIFAKPFSTRALLDKVLFDIPSGPPVDLAA